MPQQTTTSKRILELRQTLIKQIPKFPNNRATLAILQEKSLSELLIDYFTWAVRYVPPRIRKVHISPEVLNDARWELNRAGAQVLLEKIETGSDVTAHLSTEPHTRGYTPSAASTALETEKWADKDFLLNVMGFHHFHLGMELDESGYIKRTGVVLFAYATRDEFDAIALLDHSVFAASSGGTMSEERKRLWRIFDDRVLKNAAPGEVFLPPPIATSGHQVWLVQRASHCAYVIRELDANLDDPEYVLQLYEEAGVQPPKRPKIKWFFRGLELGLIDQQAQVYFALVKAHL